MQNLRKEGVVLSHYSTNFFLQDLTLPLDGLGHSISILGNAVNFRRLRSNWQNHGLKTNKDGFRPL